MEPAARRLAAAAPKLGQERVCHAHGRHLRRFPDARPADEFRKALRFATIEELLAAAATSHRSLWKWLAKKSCRRQTGPCAAVRIRQKGKVTVAEHQTMMQKMLIDEDDRKSWPIHLRACHARPISPMPSTQARPQGIEAKSKRPGKNARDAGIAQRGGRRRHQHARKNKREEACRRWRRPAAAAARPAPMPNPR